MTTTALSNAFAAPKKAQDHRVSLGSTREIWAERRRVLERRRRSVHPGGQRGDWEGLLFDTALLGFAWAMRLAGLYRRGRANALSPAFVERVFRFPDLPATFEGYRLLHVSDPHLDCLPELAGVARRLIAGLAVDSVVVTGDIRGKRHASLIEAAQPLAELLSGVNARDHVVAVLGNHDPASMTEALEQIGMTTLVNESLTVERGRDRLVLTGLDDVHRFYTPAAKQALEAAPQGFRVALVHSAEIADAAAAAGFSLYLSGHTHGGQICLPGGRSVFSRLHRCGFGARGEWRVGPMIGYTSNGLGVGEVPLRFNCRGELAVITLRRGARRD